MSERTTLSINVIRLDGGTQPRSGIDQGIVEEYAEALRRGEVLPPVQVMHDGKRYWLFDGYHRIEAHIRHGQTTQVDAEVHQGTQDDAIWESLAANKSHGLRRSRADKERAIRRALKHPRGLEASNAELGRHLGVDDKTVAKYRSEMEGRSEIPSVATRRDSRGRQQPSTQPPVAEVWLLEQKVQQLLDETSRQGEQAISSLRAGWPEQSRVERILEGYTVRANLLKQAKANVKEQIKQQLAREAEAEGDYLNRIPSTVEWLTGCPVSDTNFKGALEKASLEEVQEAIEQVQGKDGQKSRIEVLERRLRNLRALEVKCPTCHAGVGEECSMPTPGGIHPGRRIAVDLQQPEAAEKPEPEVLEADALGLSFEQLKKAATNLTELHKMRVGKPVEINGNLYVGMGAKYHGGDVTFHMWRVYRNEDFFATFDQPAVDYADWEAIDSNDRRNRPEGFYFGLACKHGRSHYTIGPKSEMLLVHAIDEEAKARLEEQQQIEAQRPTVEELDEANGFDGTSGVPYQGDTWKKPPAERPDPATADPEELGWGELVEEVKRLREVERSLKVMYEGAVAQGAKRLPPLEFPTHVTSINAAIDETTPGPKDPEHAKAQRVTSYVSDLNRVVRTLNAMPPAELVELVYCPAGRKAGHPNTFEAFMRDTATLQRALAGYVERTKTTPTKTPF